MTFWKWNWWILLTSGADTNGNSCANAESIWRSRLRADCWNSTAQPSPTTSSYSGLVDAWLLSSPPPIKSSNEESDLLPKHLGEKKRDGAYYLNHFFFSFRDESVFLWKFAFKFLSLKNWWKFGVTGITRLSDHRYLKGRGALIFLWLPLFL